MQKRVIVNADDYGHTSGVSSGIRNAHLNGIVTSTSVLINRPESKEAIECASRLCPKLGMGVHLVLTTGYPVLDPGNIPSLVREDGSFNKFDGFVDVINRIKLDEVWAEWNAQVDRFIRTAGHPPDHLDSHHHTSYFTPGLFALMIRLADELKCPIRKPFGEGSADASDYLPASLAEQSGAEKQNSPSLDLPKTTDIFIGDFYDEGATLDHLLNLIDGIIHDPIHETFELMCHPGYKDDELVATSSYNLQREREMELLMDEQVLALIKEAGIELISYSQL